ncbi:MAG: restriction endonuclease subunit S, partial [Akkermansia sp.]
MKSYPAYKNSGVPWLEEIPEHWGTKRAKYLFTLLGRPVEPHHEVITCFRDGTVTLRKNRRLTGFTESLTEVGYQGVKKGDLVIHQMDAFAGAVGISDSDGKTTPVCSVCSSKVELSKPYFAYIIRRMASSNFILSLAKGIRQRSTDFRFATFARCVLPVPPLSEQAAIASYLDRKCGEIDEMVRRRQAIIERLRELKQALIAKAVTKGLHPDVPMKDSGIPWLGQIPEGWSVQPLKYMFSFRKGLPITKADLIDEGLPVIS